MKIENFVKGEWIKLPDCVDREFFKPQNGIEAIKKEFFIWISNYPESFHPLDMKRFYAFVKIFIRYKRKNKNSQWLREQITKYNEHNLSNRNIDCYCCIFDHLINFYYFSK